MARTTKPPVRQRRSDRRRQVPSLDALLRSAAGRKASDRLGRSLVKLALNTVLEDVRAGAARGREVPEDPVILARAFEAAARDFYGIAEVINATGVLLHTGLGRAPIHRHAAAAAARVAAGYSDLEVERETGGRGRRTSHVERLLVALTGAESALAVNNGAAGLLLALATLATRKEVLVSRGELIEIGGEFRLPDIMAASGARLVEVGTTNRTRPADYRRALGPRTGLILKVHPSNYRVTGFTNVAALPELAGITGEAGIPLVYDVGSGLLDRFPGVPEDEPAVTEAVAGGADLVLFSGDKLLGGPQAGLIVGRAALVERLRRHPIARAVRLDKMTVAALEAVLRLYASGKRGDVPLWRLLETPQRALLARAKALAPCLPRATVRRSVGAVGGGSLPGHELPSAELVIALPQPDRVTARLRLGRPPVFCRIEDGAVAFDLRAVPPEDDERLMRAIRHALQQG